MFLPCIFFAHTTLSLILFGIFIFELCFGRSEYIIVCPIEEKKRADEEENKKRLLRKVGLSR